MKQHSVKKSSNHKSFKLKYKSKWELNQNHISFLLTMYDPFKLFINKFIYHKQKIALIIFFSLLQSSDILKKY